MSCKSLSVHLRRSSGPSTRKCAGTSLLACKLFRHLTQIGDFGLSRDLTSGEQNISRGKIPIRWTAPEVSYGWCRLTRLFVYQLLYLVLAGNIPAQV